MREKTDKRKFRLKVGKRAVVSLVAAALLVSVSVFGMLAYQTDAESALALPVVGHNAANLTITSEELPEMVQGFNSYSKSVSVVNSSATGSVACYIRVFVEMSDSDAASVSGYTSDGVNYYSSLHTPGSGILTEDITSAAKSGLTLTSSGSYTTAATDGTKTLNLTSSFDSHLPTGWVYVSSGTLGGYYYYTEPVKAGETSPSLLTGVLTFFPNAYSVHTYEVYIYAETVQARHLDGSEMESGDNYETIWTEYLTLGD